MTQVERREIWRERVSAFRESGQSVAAWCREQELKEHQMRYWLRRLILGTYENGSTLDSDLRLHG